MFFAWQSFFPRTRSKVPGGDLRTDACARHNRLPSAAGVTELRRYLPGLAQQSVATGAAEYFLGDQIGTTRFLTDDDQSPPVVATNRRVYTAFGELVETTGSGQTRYGYAGVWGYQEHDVDINGPDNVLGSPPTGPAIGEVFPFLHVGWRYYDPSTGRFLQRDPIGLMGGWNVYEYCASGPPSFVDPAGLLSPAEEEPYEDFPDFDEREAFALTVSGATVGAASEPTKILGATTGGLLAFIGYGAYICGGLLWDNAHYMYELARVEHEDQERIAAHPEAFDGVLIVPDPFDHDTCTWVDFGSGTYRSCP